jgi:hypothetical protein
MQSLILAGGSSVIGPALTASGRGHNRPPPAIIGGRKA